MHRHACVFVCVCVNLHWQIDGYVKCIQKIYYYLDLTAMSKCARCSSDMKATPTETHTENTQRLEGVDLVNRETV